MKGSNDHKDEVMYHTASIQLMDAYLWKGNLGQHILYLLGGLSIVPARFCADSQICMGTDAHKKIKGLLTLASLNKCLHDLDKEQKVAPIVVECINCEYFCHKGDANLPFNAELSMESKLNHMLCSDVMYYGLMMVGGISIGSLWKWEQLGSVPLSWHFQLDGSYTDEWILQHC